LIAYCKEIGKVDVIASFIEELRRQCWPHSIPREVADSELMTWADVRELSQYGIQVGAHTVSHCMLSRLDARTQEKELAESKAALEAKTGQGVDAIAYPFGDRDHFTAETKEIARRVGFKLGFSMVPGVNRLASMDRYAIRRIIPPPAAESFPMWLAMPGLMLRRRRLGPSLTRTGSEWESTGRPSNLLKRT
jgi:peptidoglycan/xylan/chitin deacetylase (PgdA/CDA1 family)